MNKATILMGLATIVATPGVAAAPAPLLPGTHWQLDYSANECRLLRTFGSGDHAVTLQITRDNPLEENGVQLALSSIDLPALPDAMSARVSVTEGKLGPPKEAFAIRPPTGKARVVAVRDTGTLGSEIATQAGTHAAMILSVTASRHETRMALGAMQAPWRAMDTCLDDLLRHWGYDPAAQRALKSEPEAIGRPETWLNWTDYPSSAANMGLQGGVRMRIDIDADGHVKGCKILASGGDDQFKALTCSLISKRARFQPAIAQDGRPIGSYWIRNVLWKMPG